MKVYDTVVIGSGAGGLATAICLARAGQKVLVLEQHYVPGGWCHSFFLKGQRFCPGVHYIGLLDKGQSTRDLYEGLGIANDLVFFRMNEKAYEHCWIGDKRIDMPAGVAQLKERLKDHFPAEQKSIDKYLTLVKNVSDQLQLIPKMKGFWDNITIPFRTPQMGKYSLFSLKRVIDWHIQDPLLKAVLNVQCGDHGLPPYRASFPVHCAVMSHYFDGAFYPMGGGGGIVKAMTNAYKRHGGELRTSAPVQKILIKNKEAYGVLLANGEEIHSKNVVSNADPTITYLSLVGKEHISKGLVKKLSKTKYSVTSLILFLTLDMDVKAAGFDSGNIWVLRDADIDGLYQSMIATNILDGDEFPAAFVSCTTLKDPASFNGRYHNIEVVTYIEYESFKQFNTVDDHHGDAYTRFKDRITEKLLNNVEKMIPGARNHVVQAELGTPKTNQYYINATEGNVYGTEKTLTQVGPFGFKNKSEIKNLYLCGASTLSHGVAGATHSGILTASSMLNCSTDDLMQPGTEQHLRIYDAEDSTHWPPWLHQKIADRKRRFKEMV